MKAIIAFARRYSRWLTVAVLLAVLTLGLLALHHLIREIHFRDVRAAFNAIQPIHIALSLGFTATSYLALTMYDYLALRVIGRPLPWRTAALASFTSYTLSHNLGLAWLTGGSARYRIYTSAGLDGPDIARVIAIASATFWLGVIAVAGFALLFHSGPISIGGFMLGEAGAHVGGIGVLGLAVAFILFCAFGPRAVSIFGWTIPVPPPKQAIAQFGISAIDLAAASAALFVLVPGADPAMLPAFILAYSLAIIIALLSHVPGGVGVFEAVVIAALPGDKATLFAALILYRLIYYLLPLAFGITLLAVNEGRNWHGPAARTLAGARAAFTGVAPMAMSAAAIAGGAILLLSGSLPAIPARLRMLGDIVPLPFIEASHIAASLVGTALLLLAPGLFRRLDGAFVATRALLIAGAIFSLFKGIDYEEALVCFGIAGLLQWTRPAFYRRTALTGQPLSPTWIVCVAAVLGLSLWAGFFAYKHVEYRDSLWWDFALHGDASRWLRTMLGVGVLLAGAALWRLFAPARAKPVAEATDPETISGILAGARHTDALLALTGDKRFLVSPSGSAFLMYQIKGSSWIVMADPVGARDEWPDLLWTIRAMADAAQGRLLLYQISAETLEIAIDLGLQIVKYGEEALVDLPGFSLEGGSRRSLRQTARRGERMGLSFAVVPAAELAAVLPQLKIVSDDWLAAKAQKEKQFSLGRFDPGYLAHFDAAIVRSGEAIVAFANLWATADKGELSVDLMRHSGAAPGGTMDFLFVELMLWGKAQGYERFSLGLAPLSGIEGRRLAPNWAKVASLLFKPRRALLRLQGPARLQGQVRPALGTPLHRRPARHRHAAGFGRSQCADRAVIFRLTA